LQLPPPHGFFHRESERHRRREGAEREEGERGAGRGFGGLFFIDSIEESGALELV
jgi:hypothetical protein